MQSILTRIQTCSKDRHKAIAIGFVGIYFIAKAAQLVYTYQAQQAQEQIMLRKRTQRDNTIQEYRSRQMYSELSPEQRDKVLSSTIPQLQQMYYDGEVTITDVVLFFFERVYDIAYPRNIITELNFDEAIQLANEQDWLLKQDREIIRTKPLFGIPVSVKDMFIQKGFDANFGVASRCFKKYEYDGIQVSQIKLAGGIIFVRTNLPQFAMTFESVNDIYGRVINPQDLNRTSGGSSGGEGAIHGSRCSMIGIGSDVGGSIRIPSAFCGVYGLKPSSTRQTDVGELKFRCSNSGQINIKFMKGPIGRSVVDIEIMMRVLLDSKNYKEVAPEARDFYWNPRDLQCLPTQKLLRIGYIKGFKYLTPAKCMTRGVLEARDALSKLGYELVEFQLEEKFERDLCNIVLRLLSAEGGHKTFLAEANGQKIIDEYSLQIAGSKISNTFKRYILRPLLKLLGQEVDAEVVDGSYKLSVYEYLCLSGLQKDINEQFLQKMYGMKLDGLIAPGFALPAIKHNTSKHIFITAVYTWVWNSLDLPAGTLPVTVVQGELDQSIPGKEKSSDNVYKIMRESMIGSEGLPVNVQVVSYPQHEEMCLRIMKDIEEQVKFRENYKYPN